jgi:DNA-binding NtrC family response regulator
MGQAITRHVPAPRTRRTARGSALFVLARTVFDLGRGQEVLWNHKSCYGQPMERVLVSWIGRADCDAAEGKAKGVGPVAQALLSRQFDRVVLLSNYGRVVDRAYQRWVRQHSQVALEVQAKTLRSPTHLGDIYLAVSGTLQELAQGSPAGLQLTFHTSPGTGPMAAIWIILARSSFPAELLTSSPDHGVSTLEAPFELAAAFVTSQRERFEQALESVSEGRPAPHAAFADIVHASDVMGSVIERAQTVAKLTAPVLIEGESGTGKELLARAIHGASDRSAGPFVAVNCGAIPRELVQASLFGHVKGAFTGATESRKGHFGEARGGTLFLDEIGELPLEQQVYLLRALQERKVLAVGSSKEVDVDVRIVAATHRRLGDEVVAGRFREDLYYRLAMLVLRLPPLRERPGDVALLVDRLLPLTATRLGATPKRLSAKAKQLLLRQPFPGNVRELEGVLARALAWSKNDVVDEAELRDALLLDSPRKGPGDALQRPLGDGFSLQETVEEVARHYLGRAHQQAGGVKRKAAELLGFANYQTYDNWRRRHLGGD